MVPAKGKIVSVKPDPKRHTKAMAEHGKIMADMENAKTSFVRVAARLAKMQTSDLWRDVTTPQHKHGFSDWDTYQSVVCGAIGRTRFYELLSVHRLSQGEGALAPGLIKQMGISRAVQVSRLPPEKRTPELLEAATNKTPLATIKQTVQGILNSDLPKDRQKEHTVVFVKSLTPEIVARYEELESRGVWMKGICDHDPTLTAKQKLFLAIITNFEANHIEELLEADKRREDHYRDKAPEVEPVHETDRWAGHRLEAGVAE